MRRLLCVCLAGLMLCGCAARPELETVTDTHAEQPMAQPLQISLSLPHSAALTASTGEGQGRFYICSDYHVTVDTLPGGDICATALWATGYLPQKLSVMETQRGSYRCYEWVWTAASEEGDQVGKCAVLDDGSYHYVLTAMAPAEKAGALCRGEWEQLFASFCLTVPDSAVSTGW